jgi:putative ABC transport system permease protein
MRIPLRLGRGITEREAWETGGVAIVNRVLADSHWPGQDPLGKQISLVDPRRGAPKWLTVVGVAGDVNVRSRGLETSPDPSIYLPPVEMRTPSMAMVVRTQGSPMELAAAVRGEIRAVAQDVSIGNLQPLTAVLAASVAERRFTMALLTVFAGLSLALSAIGVYGLVSYSVSRRTHELGVRISLGANARNVFALILGQSFRMTAVGLLAGVAAALLLTRLLGGLLFHVSPTDPLVFAGVALSLALVALAAAVGPARRALRIDPIASLKYD